MPQDHDAQTGLFASSSTPLLSLTDDAPPPPPPPPLLAAQTAALSVSPMIALEDAVRGAAAKATAIVVDQLPGRAPPLEDVAKAIVQATTLPDGRAGVCDADGHHIGTLALLPDPSVMKPAESDVDFVRAASNEPPPLQDCPASRG